MNEFYTLNYKIRFPDKIKASIDSCESYTCLSLSIDNKKYDIVNNFFMGERLIINDESGWKDIPLKKETLCYLPKELEVLSK